MESAHKQEDKLNTVAIVAVGICGAVLVYVSIVALHAYYAADSAAAFHEARYGGQRAFYDTVRAQQEAPLGVYGRKPGAGATPDSFHIPVAEAMKLVAAEAQLDPSNLVPAIGRSVSATIRPVYGRPQALPTEAAPAPIPPAEPAQQAAVAVAAVGPAGAAAPATTNPAPATTKPAPATTNPAPETTKPAPATTKPAPAKPAAPQGGNAQAR